MNQFQTSESSKQTTEKQKQDDPQSNPQRNNQDKLKDLERRIEKLKSTHPQEQPSKATVSDLNTMNELLETRQQALQRLQSLLSSLQTITNTTTTTTKRQHNEGLSGLTEDDILAQSQDLLRNLQSTVSRIQSINQTESQKTTNESKTQQTHHPQIKKTPSKENQLHQIDVISQTPPITPRKEEKGKEKRSLYQIKIQSLLVGDCVEINGGKYFWNGDSLVSESQLGGFLSSLEDQYELRVVRPTIQIKHPEKP